MARIERDILNASDGSANDEALTAIITADVLKCISETMVDSENTHQYYLIYQ